MARSLKHCGDGSNSSEGWTLEPAAWGFVVDVWGVACEAENFAGHSQSFPVSARHFHPEEIGYAVDDDAAASVPVAPHATWAFDPEQWGFAPGWAPHAK